ncbi:MAG TPA: PLP-dependent aminotransferase family protein [Pilimelia sp.]|nr:PLP-dependent aminotransferase family protein [Pilimelia sp.]
MAKAWATFGSDLHLELAGSRGRATLERALREAIQTGRLHPGTRLPSSRALAQDLGVARNTIVEAYGQLVAEGWLTAVTGSGTRVAERIVEAVPPVAPPPAARPIRYDLRAGHPDLSAFPRAAWLSAARKAVNAAPTDAFGYGDPRGRPELRHALAGYLSRARGVRTDAERIVVCNGFTQALSLLCEVLAGRGATTLAVEAYGHRSHRELARTRGMRVRETAVDAYGALVAGFGDAEAALLTPAHQFPLGVAMAAQRRTEAVRWAGATGALIVEDDYDGEFRYDRQAVGAMQALAPRSVAYAGTASKTLAPGIRLGWLVAPAHLVDDVIAAKASADRNTSALDQLTLAELIRSGGYDRHIRRCRLMYRRRRDRLVTLLRERAPRVRVTGVAAGMHAVLELPPGCDEADAVARARTRGLAVDGLGRFGSRDHRRPPALVIGYGTPPAHAFTTAIARLAAAVADLA